MDSLTLTLGSLYNAFQKWDMKSLLQLKIISSSSLFSQYQLSKRSTAKLLALTSVCVGCTQMLALVQSVIMTMLSFSSSSGSGPMKSMATLLPCLSGTESGCNGSVDHFVVLLLRWHPSHDSTYISSIFFYIFGQ